MLRPEAVVVSDHAAGLCPVLVDHVGLVRQVGQLHPLLLDIEQVGVGVQVVQPVRVHLAQLLEVGDSLLHLPHVVVRDGHLQSELRIIQTHELEVNERAYYVCVKEQRFTERFIAL